MRENTDNIQLAGQDDEIEIDLIELLYYFYSKLAWIILAFVAGAVVMGAVTFFLITPKYTASSKVYMVSASSESILDLTDLNLGTSLSKDYAEVLKSRPIFENVINNLGLEYTYRQLLGMVSISPVSDTRILEITVESPSPTEARDIANALARQAVSRLPVLMGSMQPNIIETAIVPDVKSSPSYTRNILLGALAFTALVLAFLTFRYISDDTLKSSEDVENAFGIMPLAVIPESDLGIEDDDDDEKKKFSLSATKRQLRNRKRKRKE